MKISYLDGPRLREALLAACRYGQRARAELNRINVFPVPDGDTGTNLALTLRSVADRLRLNRERALSAVARDAADAAVVGARGNCGMILSHFLLGFAQSVSARTRVTAAEFGEAMSAAVGQVYGALERPVEGTILTVIRETSEEAVHSATETGDFHELVCRLVQRARVSLAQTTERLPQLRAAGVVDAGAKGFVACLEGVFAYMQGDTALPAEGTASPPDGSALAAALAEYPVESERYRFCTEALVRSDALPRADRVKDALRNLGDSILVIHAGDVLKIHIHTDAPQEVFAYLRGFGSVLSHKAEDMRVQHAAVGRAAAEGGGLARRPIAVLSDSACDLPDAVVRGHGIHIVPLCLVFGDRPLRDRLDIDADGFIELLRAGQTPTTSQPPPAAFLQGYSRAAEEGEAIVAVLLGARLSGTFGSAEAAARQFGAASVHLIDSRAASLLQGLLVLRAAELGEAGATPDVITHEIERLRERSGIFFTVDTFDRLLASGRVSRGRAWLGEMLDIKPILGLDRNGVVYPAARARGRKNVMSGTIELLQRNIPADASSLRFGIVHVGCPEVLEEVGLALRARFGDVETITSPATPVIATHIGLGAWAVAFTASPA
ncbi:MAG: DegV family EDD domain-containing protein [Gemmatimonadetes bacterium]|nr:DegV family EDD domain-containing protein [Gemmatimonadota bacterium]